MNAAAVPPPSDAHLHSAARALERILAAKHRGYTFVVEVKPRAQAPEPKGRADG